MTRGDSVVVQVGGGSRQVRYIRAAGEGGKRRERIRWRKAAPPAQSQLILLALHVSPILDFGFWILDFEFWILDFGKQCRRLKVS